MKPLPRRTVAVGNGVLVDGNFALLVLIGFVLFCIGHLAIWCTVFNQVHATSCPKSARRGTEVLTMINVVLLGVAGLYLAFVQPNLLDPRNLLTVMSFSQTANTYSLAKVFIAYWHFCNLAAVAFIVRWLVWQWTDAKPAFWTEHHFEDFDLDDNDPDLLHGLPTQMAYAMVPGNQILSLRVEEKTFCFPQLPLALDGLRIAHLSDMHFTGRIGKPFFEQVIRKTNAAQPDVICITGDLLDKTRYQEWIESTYGQLKAPRGVFFILGNHDRYVKDVPALRDQLAGQGLVDVNGRWEKLKFDHPSEPAHLYLAGNELPWFEGAEKLGPVSSVEENGPAFFIALCHSPDEKNWAAERQFDLMLAGHTHGGQVRLPIIGPVIAPSRYGVRYASGVFRIGKMAMQVSRGISGADPLRWNCPPELCIITLKRS